MVLPHSIYEKCPLKFQKAVDEGRMLIVSFFEDDQYKATKLNAELRNEKVIEFADDVFVGYIKKGGMIEKLMKKSLKPFRVLCNNQDN